MNKTENNLKTVWKQLDDACGNLDNALINLSSMKISKDIQEKIERIDFDAIVSLKNEVEEMLEKKKENK